MYCHYYQARVYKTKTWFVVAALKSFDHMSFDRTIDTDNAILEFFVPPAMEQQFLNVMNYFCKHGYVYEFQQLPNRLQHSSEQV
jgi:hypothetical protein